MRLHESGQSFTALSRQCHVPRDVLGYKVYIDGFNFLPYLKGEED